MTSQKKLHKQVSDPGTGTSLQTILQTLLNQANTVFVKQIPVPAEAVEKYRNHYLIFDGTGKPLLHAKQSSGGSKLFLKGHDFNMKIWDIEERQVIELYRPHNFLSHETIKVFAPPGNLIGRIVKKDTLNIPTYDICSHDRKLLYTVKGSAITLTNRDSEFKILGVDGPQGTQVGRMTKKWTSGLAKEFKNLKNETDENFGVAFPEGVNIEMKVILLSACVFIHLVHCTD